MSSGGTEKWLQMMAVNLPKSQFQVDYYYCDSAPYIGSNYKHSDTDPARLSYMKQHHVHLIKFQVGAKNITSLTHDWIDTNFWDVFDESKYDLVQTAKAGPAEYPFFLLKLPIVECVTLDAEVDNSSNIVWSILLSGWQRRRWVKKGGDARRSSIIPIPTFSPRSCENLRKRLHIPQQALVFGMHQRADANIYSPIPLKAFSDLKHKNAYFLIMGGSHLYQKQARALNLKNVFFVQHSGDERDISLFLNTLDVYAHGRKDGETFGAVIAEAMMHGLPCISHYTDNSNAQVETIGNAGFCALNTKEYTRYMERMLSSNLRRKLSSLALSKAHQSYSLQAAVEQLADIYNILIQQKKIFFLIRNQRIIQERLHYYQKLGSFFMTNPRLFIANTLSRFRKLQMQYHSSSLSFTGHDSEYRAENKLEIERVVHQKYSEGDFLNLPELQLSRVLKNNPQLGKTAVDIGSGTGWFSYALSSLFKQVVAIEPSEAAIKIATTFYPSSTYKSIEWRNGFAEKELVKLTLNTPTLFITSTVLSHLPDQTVKQVCQALTSIAPVHSVLVFGECYGPDSHELLWHTRTKEWWQKQLFGWKLDFFGPQIQDVDGRHKGFSGVRI